MNKEKRKDEGTYVRMFRPWHPILYWLPIDHVSDSRRNNNRTDEIDHSSRSIFSIRRTYGNSEKKLSTKVESL